MGTSDLKDFAETKPSWDAIKDQALQILNDNFAGPNFERIRDRRDSECDKKLENQMLFNRDGLMYVLLTQVSSHGAIGLMRDLLWIYGL